MEPKLSALHQNLLFLTDPTQTWEIIAPLNTYDDERLQAHSCSPST